MVDNISSHEDCGVEEKGHVCVKSLEPKSKMKEMRVRGMAMMEYTGPAPRAASHPHLGYVVFPCVFPGALNTRS